MGPSRANREKALIARGWIRQFVADEPRLSESVALYRSLGYEVHLEPLSEEADEGECRSCLEAESDRYRIIYTRRAQGPQPEEEDEGLFGPR